jgi:hypothetical protein
VAMTKSQLPAEINTILKTFRSVGVQMRSAPAKVRSSFKWEILAAGKSQTSLRHAATKRQIRVALAKIVGSHPEEASFITYILSQCESPAL